MRSKNRKILVALAAVLVVGALTSSTALAAYSSTMYPAGDSVSLSSTPVTVTGELGIFKCTLNGGAFTVPAKGNSSGPVTVNFTTRPTYTACTSPWTVVTSGTWTLSAQYGESSVTVTAPPEGLQILNKGTVWAQNAESSLSFLGGWNNGFTSPVSVGSALTFGGAVNMYWFKLYSTKFTQSLLSLTDTTHPGSSLLLGP